MGKERLTKRTDKQGIEMIGMVNTMIAKIYDLKGVRSSLIKKKHGKISELKYAIKKVESDSEVGINRVDKDIYSIENSIKLMCGVLDYVQLSKEFEAKRKKAKGLNSLPPIANNNKDMAKEEKDKPIEN